MTDDDSTKLRYEQQKCDTRPRAEHVRERVNKREKETDRERMRSTRLSCVRVPIRNVREYTQLNRASGQRP